MNDYLVLTNADAGSNDEQSLDGALEVLRGAGKVSVVATSDASELDEVLEGTTSTVVVAGGDGSLHAVVNALRRLSLNVPLGLVPLGTGNDFARGAGIPLEPDAAARLITTTEPTRVDLVVDGDDKVVVNSVHLGVGAQAGLKAKAMKPALGRLGYAAGALVAGVRPSFLRVRVTVDGEPVVGPEVHVAQVVIGNGSMVGGGAELAPGADPTDGRLDVVVSRATGPLARLSYLAQLRVGRHVERNDVISLHGTEVVVEGQPFHLSADGELSGPHTSASWRLARGALSMHL